MLKLTRQLNPLGVSNDYSNSFSGMKLSWWAASLCHINVSGLDRIFVQITVATAALTGFAIKAKSNTDAAASTLYSTAGDFTTPVGLLVGASGDLTIQGVGVGWFIMDVSGLESIILTATSGGTATLAVEAGGA